MLRRDRLGRDDPAAERRHGDLAQMLVARRDIRLERAAGIKLQDEGDAPLLEIGQQTLCISKERHISKAGYKIGGLIEG